MTEVEQAKLFAALLGVLKKENSKLKKVLAEELRDFLDSELDENIIVGPMGPEGPEGPQGPIGLQGLQGRPGSDGKDGVEGPVGPRGEQGIHGEKGDTGPQGDIGPKGDKGDRGEQGFRGDKGDTGDIGLQGPQGEKGDIGETGPQGTQGEQGPRGEKGEVGEQGLKGDTGERGEKGDPGPISPQGLQGIQGPEGDKGDKGDKGDAGPQGPKGDDGLTPDVAPIEKDLSKKFEALRGTIDSKITQLTYAAGGSSSGGGEVRLEFLDDVDRDSVKVDNRFLKYNAATGKFVGATVSGGSGGSGDVANTYLQATFVSNTAFQSYVANTNARINTLESAGGGGSISSTDELAEGNTNFYYTNDRVIEYLGAVTANIVPATDQTVSLGTSNKRFYELYLSGNTINLGGALIKSDGSGSIEISATGALLPQNSKVTVGSAQRQLATVSSVGTTGIDVPFYTKASGLSTAAATFTFQPNINRKVFTNFTTKAGVNVVDTDITRFTF